MLFFLYLINRNTFALARCVSIVLVVFEWLTGEIIPADSTLVFDVELVEIVQGKLKFHKVDGPDCEDKETADWHDKVSVLYNGFSEKGFKFNGG